MIRSARPLTLTDLYQRAADEGIDVDDMRLRSLLAASFREGWIVMDTSRMEGEIEEKNHLAHELGHVETGSFYDADAPVSEKRLCEYRANVRAVSLLLPLDQVRRAVRHGCQLPWQLAELFDVTEQLAAFALELYRDKLKTPKRRKKLTQADLGALRVPAAALKPRAEQKPVLTDRRIGPAFEALYKCICGGLGIIGCFTPPPKPQARHIDKVEVSDDKTTFYYTIDEHHGGNVTVDAGGRITGAFALALAGDKYPDMLIYPVGGTPTVVLMHDENGRTLYKRAF